MSCLNVLETSFCASQKSCGANSQDSLGDLRKTTKIKDDTKPSSHLKFFLKIFKKLHWIRHFQVKYKKIQLKKLNSSQIVILKLTMKCCCLCERDYEKPNFHSHLQSKQYWLETGTKTKCNECKKFYNTGEKCHECQLKVTNKKITQYLSSKWKSLS